jgi:type VI secretion system protein ImpC
MGSCATVSRAMSRSSTLASVQIDVSEQPEPVRRIAPESPFRILVAGDFSGGAGRNRRPIPVDRDNFDEVLSLLGPELRLPVGGQEVALRFRELDDFHPDWIVRHLPEPQAQPQRPEPPAAPPISGAELLRQMMGEAAAPAAAAAPQNDWNRMIDELVAPHTVPKPDPSEAVRTAQRDAARTVQMRALLHHPKFQALEAAWRGLFFLIRRLETGEDLKISLIDLPQRDLAGPAGLIDLERAVITDGTGTPGGEPWAVIAGLYDFGPDDEPALTRIAAVARGAGAPFIAGLAAGVVGLTRVFSDLRQSTDARWVGLALPRFLLRLPYGKATDSTESFAFEEMPSPPEHERYLWGHPAVACAYLLGEAFAQYGWSMRPGAIDEIAGLPLHVYKTDGQSELKPCAEVWLTEDAAELLLDRGFMPLASIKATDRVRLVRFQSIAEPAAPLAGRWI